jgi:hypothetical protein
MTGAALSDLFHVEHSFSDAETPEQGIQHVLNAGLAGDSIERGPRGAKIFREN